MDEDVCWRHVCASNWSRLSSPVPCLGFVWAESTNYILLARGQALNHAIPRTNITQQTLLTRVLVELRHRTRDASLAASNQASAGNKPTVLMKKGASSLLIIMQCARTDYFQNNWWIVLDTIVFELVWAPRRWLSGGQNLSLIHIWRCRRSTLCRSRWSPYH